MFEYVLVALVVSTANINDVASQSIAWNPVPINTYATYKECENVYNDLSGFPRRPNDYGWPKYNAMLKCVKVNKE